MLSYRHAFHAGNHADVLKHLLLVLCLDHLLAKAGKALVYIDTHAGAGGYDLDDARTALHAEYTTGIAPLLAATGLPVPLARYVNLIRGFNPVGAMRHYPGSPAIARHLMPDGRLELCELHPDDHRRLAAWAAGDKRIRVHREDGFGRLRALLPPAERRALVLIDPPYEVKQDYRNVVDALRDALRRFATGVYLLWYPLLARKELPVLRRQLDALPGSHLRVELEVAHPAAQGLIGSGVFILNPPFRLMAQLADCGPVLRSLLCAPGAGGLSLRPGRGKD